MRKLSETEETSVIIYEKYHLVEKDESKVSLKWKGAHLMIFLMAFIFATMCTFSLNVLAYMFEKRCVLNPQLMSLDASKHSFIFDFLPVEDAADAFPADFLSIQWAEEEECTLPVFVPVCSAVFGLIWTTMFLMCSSGSHTHNLQRPWRLMMPVLVFSLMMSCLCVHASLTTHRGLRQLCHIIGKFTGNEDCSFAMNVVTLPYEGRIRGVYQAVKLTIYTAWLHTSCWLLATALVILRILLVVDFQMVCVRARLEGNIEAMLEKYEKQLRCESLESGYRLQGNTKLTTQTSNEAPGGVILLFSRPPHKKSSGGSEETDEENYHGIKSLLSDLIDTIALKKSVEINEQSMEPQSDSQSGTEREISSQLLSSNTGVAPEIKQMLNQNLNEVLNRADYERHVSFSINMEQKPEHSEVMPRGEDEAGTSAAADVSQRMTDKAQESSDIQKDDNRKPANATETGHAADDDAYSASTESINTERDKEERKKKKMKMD